MANKKWTIFSVCFPPELAMRMEKECGRKTMNRSLFLRELVLKYFHEINPVENTIYNDDGKIEKRSGIVNPLSNFYAEELAHTSSFNDDVKIIEPTEFNYDAESQHKTNGTDVTE